MNFVANPGSGGTTFGSDTESGPAEWPLVKLGWGAAAAGQRITAATPMPVVNLPSGRNARVFMLDTYNAAPVAEALQSVVQWYSNAAVAATTTPAVVPAGKTLRLTHVWIATKSLATVGSAVLRIRANTAGVAALASPLVYSIEAGSQAGATTTAMTGGESFTQVSLPEGIDLPAGTGVGFTLAGYGPTGTLTLEGVTRFAVVGYEF
jgi:hypothetical protein